MRDKLFSAAIAVALASVAGSACAMTDGDRSNACRVIGGEKLPAESGGAEALCKAITDAASKQALAKGYNIEVTVLPMSRLSAKIIMADGRQLPEQNFVQMDKPLSNLAFQRFATALAAEMAKANGKLS